MSKFIFSEINKDEAKKVWFKTFSQNCFNDPLILENLNHKIKYFMVTNQGTPIIFWPTIINNNNIIIPNNFYYVGPTLTDEFYKLKNHSKVSVLNETLECGLNEIFKKFKKIHFQSHPSFNDIRYFLWNKNLNVNIKYSAFLQPQKDFIINWRDLRKRQLKKILKIKEKLYIDQSVTFNEILNLAQGTIGANKKNLKEYINLDFFIKLYEKQLSKVFSLREKKTKKILSICYTIEDQKSVNLIYNFADNQWKNDGIIQLNIYQVIKYCLKKKKILDFNGANSYVGADDKGSYGSEERIYFSFINE